MGGCVGKGSAYGARKGLFVVQGDADSRCGVRLSGADPALVDRLREPRLDALGFLADRANPWVSLLPHAAASFVVLRPELEVPGAAPETIGD